MNASALRAYAREAADLMRSLANEKRLLIVCQLVDGEKSVTAISDALGIRQTTVSQQLSLLRREGVVQPRRDAQTVYYSLTSDHVRSVVELLYTRFCRPRPASGRRR